MVREPADYTKLAVLTLMTASLIGITVNTMNVGWQILGGFQDKSARAFDDTTLEELLKTSMQEPIPAPVIYRTLMTGVSKIRNITINSNKDLELVQSAPTVNKGVKVITGNYLKREVNLNGDIKTINLLVKDVAKDYNSPRSDMDAYGKLAGLLQESGSKYYVDFSPVAGSTDIDLKMYREVPRLVEAMSVQTTTGDTSQIAKAIEDVKKGVYKGDSTTVPGNALVNPGNSTNPGGAGNQPNQGGKFIGKLYVEDYKEYTTYDTETNIPDGYLVFKDAGGNEILTVKNDGTNKAVLLSMGSVGSITDGNKFLSGAVQMPNKSGIVKLSNDVQVFYYQNKPDVNNSVVKDNEDLKKRIAELEEQLKQNKDDNSNQSNQDANTIAELEKEIDKLKNNGEGSDIYSILANKYLYPIGLGDGTIDKVFDFYNTSSDASSKSNPVRFGDLVISGTGARNRAVYTIRNSRLSVNKDAVFNFTTEVLLDQRYEYGQWIMYPRMGTYYFTIKDILKLISISEIKNS